MLPEDHEQHPYEAESRTYHDENERENRACRGDPSQEGSFSWFGGLKELKHIARLNRSVRCCLRDSEIADKEKGVAVLTATPFGLRFWASW